MTISPIISIILPTHNRPKLLEEAIESIISQNITDWELIIIDDNSTPAVNNQYIQEKFGEKIQVLNHVTSKGGAEAKNTGIKAARGKYIAFLDDDDLYAPNYLKNAIETLENNPQINTLFMGVSWFGPKSEWAQDDYDKAMNKILDDAKGIEISKELLQFDTSLFTALLKRVPMAFQRPVTQNLNLQQIGFYQDTLLWDCDWALRASLNGSCGLLNEDLYRQRTAGQGYSSKPSRRLDHMLSNLQIKKDLLTHLQVSPYKKSIFQAIIKAGQDLAWEYITQKKGGEAVKTTLSTFYYGFSFLQIKFLLHSIYTCIVNIFSHNKNISD